MVDVHSPAQRSANMTAIRAHNTKPEVLVRKLLFARGFRFRLHVKNLPGSPDIVLPKYSTVIFVQGCFWHRHDCYLFRWPDARKEFWQNKIGGNVERDRRAIEALRDAGWHIVYVWECALKGRLRWPIDTIGDRLGEMIRSPKVSKFAELRHLPEIPPSLSRSVSAQPDRPPISSQKG